MSIRNHRQIHGNRIAGVTLIEMMVTMVIGSFLTLGALTIFSQSRSTYKTTDTTSRLQENARFALSQIEPDLRLAQFWGMTNKSSLVTVPAAPLAANCGATNLGAWVQPNNPSIWAYDSNYPLVGALQCNAFNNAWRANTDVLVVRHASGPATAATAGVIQIQTTRTAGALFNNGVLPYGAPCTVAAPAPTCENHDLEMHLYYISSQSSLGATTPSLRRKTLTPPAAGGGGMVVTDQEIIPGVEDLQVELGIDTNGDNTVDRYVDPNNAIVTPTARILAVRYWLLLRTDQTEIGFVDSTPYQYANVPQFVRNDQFRRLIVGKTVLLRNIRT